MEFLYAYMPLSDLADYKPEFFSEKCTVELAVPSGNGVGKNIPEENFFILYFRSV